LHKKGGYMESNFTIGIIGGKGKMGQLFKNFFEKKGYPVLISDVGTELSNVELVKKSKVILISVPMSIFADVLKEIAPFVEEKHWIMDVCSLKSEPAKLMKTHLEKGEILATHPLFGPFEKDLRNKIIAFWPIRGKNVTRWFIEVMTEEGLKLVKVPPKKHDKIMALVQVLNHFWLILLGNIIQDSGLELEEIVSLSTPSFLKQLDILKRFAKQDPKLYEKIQLENPWGKNFRKIFCQNCKNLTKALNSDNAEEVFEKYFNIAQEVAKQLEILLDKFFSD